MKIMNDDDVSFSSTFILSRQSLIEWWELFEVDVKFMVFSNFQHSINQIEYFQHTQK